MNKLVFLEPNKIDAYPQTTTLIIAQEFGKSHFIVMRDARKLIADLKDSLSAVDRGAYKFVLTYYQDEQGKSQPTYFMNRDFYMMLVMGYKTKKAYQIKHRFIQAFNLMENELMRRHIERAQLKPIRREMTDIIQQVTESKWAYKMYTDLAYKLITGKIASKLREERGAPKKAVAVDYMTADEIHAVTEMQYRIAVLLEMGMDYAMVKETLQNRLMLKAS